MMLYLTLNINSNYQVNRIYFNQSLNAIISRITVGGYTTKLLLKSNDE